MKKLTTNIDFTTLFGSSVGFQSDIIAKNGLSLSRLLNISHLVESIVLNSIIQFEFGNTPIWEPYRESLEKTSLYQLLSKERKMLSIIEEPIDNDDCLIGDLLKTISNNIYQEDLHSLKWAVSFRGGIFNELREFPKLKTFDDDTNNSFVDRYLKIIKDTFSEIERQDFIKAVKYLEINQIGIIGIHVLLRIALWEQKISENENSIYSPHFSRQPLIYSSNNPTNFKTLHEWNMDKLRECSKSLRTNALNIKEDELIDYLSPVFIACLDNAKKPMEIIENALNIRNSKYAKDYRMECESLIVDEINERNINVNQYKINMLDKMRNLNDFLYSKGKTKTVMTNISLTIPKNLPFGWQRTIRKTKKIDNLKGKKSSYLLSDILQQSISIYQVGKKINRIFGVDFKFDTSIQTINMPVANNKV